MLKLKHQLFLALVAVLLLATSAFSKEPPRPNVVLIFADDLGCTIVPLLRKPR